MTVEINGEEISCLSISKKEYEKQMSKFRETVFANHADNKREIIYEMSTVTYIFKKQHYTLDKTILNTGLTDIILHHYWCDEGFSFKK